MLSYLTETVPADCLFPNDDVGRGDIPLAMLAVPTCDTTFIDVFSALRYRSAGSAETGASSACQLFAFTESSARVRFVGKHARRTEERVEGNTKGGPSWILLVSMLWSVLGSLSKVSSYICRVSPGSFVTQPQGNM